MFTTEDSKSHSKKNFKSIRDLNQNSSFHRIILYSYLIIATIAQMSCKKNEANPDQPVVSWLHAHAIPVNNADPVSPEPNLSVLKEIIGDARLVGLGEATHGTTEFWGIRQKVSEYLIKEMGFTAILMEAGFPNSLYINEYITNGTGTAAEAHEKLGTWRYQEMRDLIEWMHNYNLEYADQGTVLQYIGYDCAFHNWIQAINLISEYIQSVDSTAEPDIKERLNNYTTDDAEYVLDYFVSFAEEFISKSSDSEYHLILRIVENLVPNWTVWYNVYNDLPDLGIRDEFNLENVNWIINNMLNGGKVIIWAHNGHVGNTILTDNQDTEAQMLGSRLKIQFGQDYYVIATEFYKGEFLAWDRCENHEFLFTIHQAALPFTDTYAYQFHLADIPLFFLDLRQVNYSLQETEWLMGPLNMRFIGATYCKTYDREYYSRPVYLPNEYDGIIFFEDTHPAQSISF